MRAGRRRGGRGRQSAVGSRGRPSPAGLPAGPRTRPRPRPCPLGLRPPCWPVGSLGALVLVASCRAPPLGRGPGRLGSPRSGRAGHLRAETHLDGHLCPRDPACPPTCVLRPHLCHGDPFQARTCVLRPRSRPQDCTWPPTCARTTHLCLPAPHLATHPSPTRPMLAVGLPLRDALIAAGFFDGVFLLSGRGSQPLRGHVTGRCPRWCEPRAPHGARASGPGGARWRAAGGQITPAPAGCAGSTQPECGKSSGLSWGWGEGRYPEGWYREDCGRSCVAGGEPPRSLL